MSKSQSIHRQELLKLLHPIAAFIQTQKMDADLQYQLESTYPIANPDIQRIKALCLQGIQEGWIRMYGNDDLRYCNLHRQNKALPIRIDMVNMTGVGPGHTHISGEANLCFALEGNPSFDGLLEGWVVKTPSSWHKPTVQFGRMLILYFIPNGQIAFD